MDPPDDEPVITFTDITAESGLSRRWGISTGGPNFIKEFASGLAAADYDDDGDIDLFATGGDVDPNHLYENQGDGNFAEVGLAAGLHFLHLGSAFLYSSSLDIFHLLNDPLLFVLLFLFHLLLCLC